MKTNDQIVDLIVKLYKEKGYSLSEFARLTGFPKSSLSRYFNKSRQFPINKVEIFATVLGTTSSFLLGFSDDKSIIAQVSTIMENLEVARQKKVLHFSKVQEYEQNYIADNQEDHTIQLYPVRVQEALAAGMGYNYSDNEIQILYTDRDDLKSYNLASLVVGDSMYPLYRDGDVVLIRTGYDSEPGAVYAVDFDGKSYLKKVYFESNGCRLVSINHKYSDIFVELPCTDYWFNIIGKVVDSFTPVDAWGTKWIS